MKLSDILSIHKAISRLPHAVASWALTVTTIISVAAIYISIKTIATDLRVDREKNTALLHQLIKADSAQRVALKVIINGQVLQDMKIQTIGEHVSKLEKNDGVLLREVKRIDEVREILLPFRDDLYLKSSIEDPDEKKKLTDTTKLEIKWHRIPKK